MPSILGLDFSSAYSTTLKWIYVTC
jgi:hypothetical protein